ncbi:hypothetical protein Ciccas_014261, partial [Cichlidogyrus casuarinus]
HQRGSGSTNVTKLYGGVDAGNRDGPSEGGGRGGERDPKTWKPGAAGIGFRGVDDAVGFERGCGETGTNKEEACASG